MVDIDLASFSFDYSEIVKGAAEVKKQIDELKTQQRELTKEGKQGSEQFVQNAADLKTLNGVYNEHVKYLANANKETLDQATRGEALNAVLEQEATTIKGLREQNKILNQLRNSANLATEEGRQELELLNARLDENNAKIKENVDAYTQQKIGIGDYAGGVKEALREMNPFNVSISVFIQNAQKAGGVLPMLANGFKAVTQGIVGMTRAALAFIATPIGAVIAAIGLTLGLIINYLKSTQEGMDAVTKVTRPLSAIFQALIGILQDVGKFLFEAFSNPLDTLKTLYEFIKNQVMRQFQAFGKILEGIFTLDFGLVKEGFSDLADQVMENLEMVGDAFGEMSDRLKEAARAGAEIDRLQKEIEQREIDIIGLRAENTLALKEQENIMQNQLLTSEERSAAIAEHARLTEEMIAAEEKIIKAQIQQLKLKQSLNDTSREELKQLAELEASLVNINQQRLDSERRSLRVIKQLEDERNRDAKKAIDDRLIKEKELIDLYIQQQGIQSRTLSEQLQMEQAVSEMKLALLDKELKSKKISQEQYAREVLAIQQNLARREAELAVEKAGRELSEYKKSFEQQMEERRFLSDEVAKNKIDELNDLLAKEEKFQELRLEKGLINQQEFDDAIYGLQEANRLAVAEINKEREETEKQEALELRALEFEEELERMLAEGATRFELEQAQIAEQFQVRQNALEEQLEQGLISQELYAARMAQIARERANAEKEIEAILADEKFKISTGLFDAAAEVIDKDSKLQKSISLAKAAMNMYQGISAGVALGFPAAIPAVAFATATGAKAISDITSTKIPSAGGGNIGGGNSPVSSAMNLSGQGVNLGSANAAVQNQIQQQADMSNMTTEIAEAVQQGAQAGTEQGSQQGITNLSENRQIMQNSAF